jgi:hypothetical protein
MAGSMGFAVNNTRAVLEGLFRKKSEFVRTPKYKIEKGTDSWKQKKYASKRINWVVIIEATLAVYCFIGVIASFYYLELAAVPFHLLFFFGFAIVSALSISHSLESRKTR